MAPQIMKFQLAPCQNPPKNIVVNKLKFAAIPLISRNNSWKQEYKQQNYGNDSAHINNLV